MATNDTSSNLVKRFSRGLIGYSDVAGCSCCGAMPTPAKKPASNAMRAQKTITSRRIMHGEKTMPPASVSALVNYAKQRKA